MEHYEGSIDLLLAHYILQLQPQLVSQIYIQIAHLAAVTGYIPGNVGLATLTGAGLPFWVLLLPLLMLPHGRVRILEIALLFRGCFCGKGKLLSLILGIIHAPRFVWCVR